MARRFRSFALVGSLLAGALASRVAAQEVPQSPYRAGIRVLSAELRDTINPRWPTSGKWLVVRTVKDHEDSLPARRPVSLTSAGAKKEIFPRYQVLELGPASNLWQEPDTTMTPYLDWPGPRIPVQLVFDVSAATAPYRLHIGPLCFVVPFAAAVPRPDARCVSLRVLSTTLDDSALVKFRKYPGTLLGPWLVVWVEMAVAGEPEVDAGSIALLSSTENSCGYRPDALLVEATGGSTREFIRLLLDRQTLTSPIGGKVVFSSRNNGRCTLSELTIQGRQRLGFVFDVHNRLPPYGLFFGDSSYAVPLDVRREPFRGASRTGQCDNLFTLCPLADGRTTGHRGLLISHRE